MLAALVAEHAVDGPGAAAWLGDGRTGPIGGGVGERSPPTGLRQGIATTSPGMTYGIEFGRTPCGVCRLRGILEVSHSHGVQIRTSSKVLTRSPDCVG